MSTFAVPLTVGKIDNILNAEEIGPYVDHLERTQAPIDAEEDAMIETPEQRDAARERFSRWKELLTSKVLGTLFRLIGAGRGQDAFLA